MFEIYSVKRLIAYILMAIFIAVVIGVGTYSFVKYMT
jgi:hypothetical protein